MHAGEPFGILADVDREHLPDLVKMLNRFNIWERHPRFMLERQKVVWGHDAAL